jgi:hypothetical protein
VKGENDIADLFDYFLGSFPEFRFPALKDKWLKVGVLHVLI